MEGLSFSKTARRTFHDVPYSLTISGDNENITIEVEHAEDGRRWRSKFAARFIEEITQRTGNSKKFDIFVRMLLSALAQESDAVYLDVLTARDLEMLRRHANPQGPPTTTTAGQSDKRYLILTYRAEFDKVHYPLPLPMDEQSEEDALRAVISRLKMELADARQFIDQKGSATSLGGASDERADALQRQNADLSDALRVARREVDQMKGELRLRTSGVASSSNGNAQELQKLRDAFARQQAETKGCRDEARQQQAAAKAKIDQLTRELRTEKQKGDRLQAQVRKLEDERSRMGAQVRGPSAERSRPVSRTPSVERPRPGSRPPSRTPSRPSSRPSSRPVSRASSVASSRDRTPSPSSFLRGQRSAEEKPWAFRREPRAPSPNSTLSPYRNASGSGYGAQRRTPSPGQRAPSGAGRRTPSPGTRGARERTPSPARASGAAPPVAAPRRSALSLSDRPPDAAPAPPLNARAKPASSRHGSRPDSASRAGAPLARVGSAKLHGAPGSRPGSRGPGDQPGGHRPGSLFGLAANLGLGPGSVPPSGAVGCSSTSASDDDGACDIDERLQALQAFLKQTKTVAS